MALMPEFAPPLTRTKMKTPDQIAQEVADRVTEWLSIEPVYSGIGADEDVDPEYALDDRQLRMVIIEILEREARLHG